jgi:anti-repressor protein
VSAIQPFQFDGTDVRVVTDEHGEPWFVGTDVAKVLGYRNPSDAIGVLDEDERKTATLALSEGSREVTRERTLITEAGVYTLTFGSSLPSAKAFRRWLTHDVIPAIRRTGSYAVAPALPQDYATALRALASEVEAKQLLEAKVEADAPKVLFADAVATSHTEILVGELAKILRGNGVQVGGTRMFEWLRRDGYLIRREGTDWNMPTQRSMELGLFRIKETAITHSDGHTSVSKTPKVTGKGQAYFVNRYAPTAEVAA